MKRHIYGKAIANRDRKFYATCSKVIGIGRWKAVGAWSQTPDLHLETRLDIINLRPWRAVGLVVSHVHDKLATVK